MSTFACEPVYPAHRYGIGNTDISALEFLASDYLDST